MAAALVSLWGCGESPPIREIVSVRIMAVDRPVGAGGPSRTLRVAEDPAAAALARALVRCRGPEIVKFMPSYRVTAIERDGSEVTFLLRGEYVTVAGVAYGCSEDIEKLVERALGTATDHGR